MKEFFTMLIYWLMLLFSKDETRQLDYDNGWGEENEK